MSAVCEQERVLCKRAGCEGVDGREGGMLDDICIYIHT